MSCCLLAAVAACPTGGWASLPSAPPLRMVVMDPLAAPLACACVLGHAQRQYDRLAQFLERRLGRPVIVTFGESLTEVLSRDGSQVDLVIGKQSVVESDSLRVKMSVRRLALLTDTEGRTDVWGLFVVRTRDPAQRLSDLSGYRIQFGPVEEAEKHAAAVAALESAGIAVERPVRISPGCNIAALAVAEKQADAAVISSYAFPLLEGCGTINKGSLCVVGRTEGVPFITVFATERVTSAMEKAVLDALVSVADDASLLKEMESQKGFLRLSGESAAGTNWSDWRGEHRDALSGDVPASLPSKVRFLWQRPLTGNAVSGIAATVRYVIVGDKTPDYKKDVWRCLNADKGEEVWTVSYEAAEEMDYTNSPRATPVIHEERVYLLGAFGDLHCVRLADGGIVWKKNLLWEFKSKVPTWGMCSTPLVVDDMLIVNPGTKEASLVALDLHTGRVAWKTPGETSAYSSFIEGVFGGVRQIVGYDAVSLGGWDIQTGKRLWQLVPPESGDFNVGTPVNAGGRLLVATENNGTRLYGFDEKGAIVSRPLAENLTLAPDTSTPIVVNGLVLGCSGKLVCLDVEDSLKTLWASDDERFADYATLIGGKNRVLITTVTGEVVLIEPGKTVWRLNSSLKAFGKGAEVWSHPALVAGRLYIRNQNSVSCMLLGD